MRTRRFSCCFALPSRHNTPVCISQNIYNATDISKAERDLKELTPEQLAAVALALGVAVESLTDAPPVLSEEELEWLKLFKEADPDTQNAAAAVLKGEAALNSNPMAAMMEMFGGMMGGGDKKEAPKEDKKEE
jgi:hypothetical protein